VDDLAPLELHQLFRAPDALEREAAWEELIARHTRLLLAVAASFGGGHDAKMERYAYVLEKLREQDFRRLRVFKAQGSARFSTWLTVAARNLCLDYARAHYGRSRGVSDEEKSVALRQMRRRLADWVGDDLNLELIPDSGTPSADSALSCAERDTQLAALVRELPARDRLLLSLRFEDDLSASEIKDVLHLPTPFHVYRRLTAVLAQLRVLLKRRGIDGSDG
jgi:RNA polymerase sigma factor (sigma-70 family)